MLLPPPIQRLRKIVRVGTRASQLPLEQRQMTLLGGLEGMFYEGERLFATALQQAA